MLRALGLAVAAMIAPHVAQTPKTAGLKVRPLKHLAHGAVSLVVAQALRQVGESSARLVHGETQSRQPLLSVGPTQRAGRLQERSLTKPLTPNDVRQTMLARQRMKRSSPKSAMKPPLQLHAEVHVAEILLRLTWPARFASNSLAPSELLVLSGWKSV